MYTPPVKFKAKTIHSYLCIILYFRHEPQLTPYHVRVFVQLLNDFVVHNFVLIQFVSSTNFNVQSFFKIVLKILFA